jgi:GWxTD domain-containing protein
MTHVPSRWFANSPRRLGRLTRIGSLARIVQLARAAPVLMVASSILVGAPPVRAQYPNPGPPTQPETPVPGTSSDRPRFSVDATVEPGSGMPIVRLDYRLARAELLFERRSGGYHASYEVRAVFCRDKGGRQITGDVFVRELNVRTYAETRPIGGDIIDHVDLPVPPDKYDVHFVIRDLVAERASGTQIEVEIPAQAAGPLWFSDLSFGTSRVPASGGSDPRTALELNPSRRYSDDIAAMAVAGEIVDSRPATPQDAVYRIEYRVLNDAQERVLQRDTTIARREGRTAFVLYPGIPSLAPGSYRFVVELKSPVLPAAAGRRSAPIRREKSFEVLQSVASIAADPRNTFDVLRYIATSEEADEMGRMKTEEERRVFWEGFWKRRDPSPETPLNEARDEFYRRVQYANQHFSVGRQGWRTDMGRIYIKYGQPDEVSRSPFNFDRPPEEIWYYYRDRHTFYFVDKDGFGLYMLDENRSR